MTAILINNFGLVSNVIIDIKPLTLFMGINNSGKSFIARLIHSLYSIDDISSFDVMEYLDENNQRLFKNLNQKSINHLKNNNAPFKVPAGEFNMLLNDGIFRFFSKTYTRIIYGQFGDDLDSMINFNKDFFRVEFEKICLKKHRGEALNFSYDFGNEDILIYSGFSEFYNNCYIEILNEIRSTNSYYIKGFESVDSTKMGDFYDLACEFERDFSNILVDINSSGDIIYRESQTQREIPSNLVSSSVHEMASFIIYLKYVLGSGDLLVIEEPEAHLHPEKQILFLKCIAKAVNHGLKIIMTTQGEYISDKLNNLVRLSNLSDENLESLNYTKDHIINCKDLAIYDFKRIAEHECVAERLDVDETGFFEENFSKTVNELYHETIEIIKSD